MFDQIGITVDSKGSREHPITLSRCPGICQSWPGSMAVMSGMVYVVVNQLANVISLDFGTFSSWGLFFGKHGHWTFHCLFVYQRGYILNWAPSQLPMSRSPLLWSWLFATHPLSYGMLWSYSSSHVTRFVFLIRGLTQNVLSCESVTRGAMAACIDVSTFHLPKPIFFSLESLMKGLKALKWVLR